MSDDMFPDDATRAALVASLSTPCYCGARESARAFLLPEWAVAAVRHAGVCPARGAARAAVNTPMITRMPD